MKLNFASFCAAVFGAILACAFCFVVGFPRAERAADRAASSVLGASDSLELQERLAGLEAELRRLQDEVQALRATAPIRDADEEARASTGQPQVDLRKLGAELARRESEQERKRVEGLGTNELFAEMRKALRKDRAEARVLLAALLRRPLTKRQRADVLSRLGFLDREAGDLHASESKLLEAVRTGANTSEGAWASYELALTVSALGDHARALEVARSIERTPDLSDWIRFHGAWATATLTEKAGSLEAAKSLYAELLASCRGKAGFEWLVRDLERRLR